VAFRIALFEDSLLAELIKRQQRRDRFTGLLIEVTQPLFLSAAFGETLLNAHALRQLRGHLIDGFALKTRLDGPIGKNHV